MRPDDAPILSLELLEELEQRWRALRVPIAGRLRPGLTDREIDETTAPIGLSLPPEARTWLTWHDGADPPFPNRIGGLTTYEFVPIASLVAKYEAERRIDAEIEEDIGRPDGYWPRTIFPLVGGQLALVCDCPVPAGDRSPIYYHDPTSQIVLDDPVAWSFGQVVTWWIEAIDDGDWIGDERGWSGRPPRSARPGEGRPGHQRFAVI